MKVFRNWESQSVKTGHRCFPATEFETVDKGWAFQEPLKDTSCLKDASQVFFHLPSLRKFRSFSEDIIVEFSWGSSQFAALMQDDVVGFRYGESTLS